jgi:hypothetical protein
MEIEDKQELIANDNEYKKGIRVSLLTSPYNII